MVSPDSPADNAGKKARKGRSTSPSLSLGTYVQAAPQLTERLINPLSHGTPTEETCQEQIRTCQKQMRSVVANFDTIWLEASRKVLGRPQNLGSVSINESTTGTTESPVRHNTEEKASYPFVQSIPSISSQARIEAVAGDDMLVAVPDQDSGEEQSIQPWESIVHDFLLEQIPEARLETLQEKVVEFATETVAGFLNSNVRLTAKISKPIDGDAAPEPQLPQDHSQFTKAINPKPRENPGNSNEMPRRKKRKMDDPGDDSSDEDGDSDEDKDPHSRKWKVTEPSPFSCPFKKRNPSRFNIRDHPACMHPFSNIASLK